MDHRGLARVTSSRRYRPSSNHVARSLRHARAHAAAHIVGGKTVAHLLHFDKLLHGNWVIIDEVYLLPIDTLGQIAQWQMVGARFVLFGDFEGQFEAFIDRWKEVSYADVPQSQLLMDMCSRTRFHMEVYRRGDDQALYGWYTSLYKEPD